MAVLMIHENTVEIHPALPDTLHWLVEGDPDAREGQIIYRMMQYGAIFNAEKDEEDKHTYKITCYVHPALSNDRAASMMRAWMLHMIHAQFPNLVREM